MLHVHSRYFHKTKSEIQFRHINPSTTTRSSETAADIRHSCAPETFEFRRTPADDSDHGPSTDASNRTVHVDTLQMASAERTAAESPDCRLCRLDNDDDDSCRAPVRRTSSRRGVSSRDWGPPTLSRRTPIRPKRSYADSEQMSRITIIACHHVMKRVPIAKKHRNAFLKIRFNPHDRVDSPFGLSEEYYVIFTAFKNRSKLWDASINGC